MQTPCSRETSGKIPHISCSNAKLSKGKITMLCETTQSALTMSRKRDTETVAQMAFCDILDLKQSQCRFLLYPFLAV